MQFLKATKKKKKIVISPPMTKKLSNVQLTMGGSEEEFAEQPIEIRDDTLGVENEE